MGDEWDAIHAAAALLRETGQLQTELLFTAGPTDLCVLFLNWEPAVGGENLRRLPGPLRVRRAHDLGWKPGLWLKSDHERYAAEQRDKPKRKLFAALSGRSSSDTTTVADEFRLDGFRLVSVAPPCMAIRAVGAPFSDDRRNWGVL